MQVYNDHKFRKIQERAHQSNLAVQDLNDRIRDAKRRMETAESHFTRTDSDAPTDADRDRLEKSLRPIRADLKFYETEIESAQREKTAIAPIARRLEERLHDLRSEGRLEPDDEIEPPKPVMRKKGEADLEKIREQIAQAQSQRDEISAAPLTADEAKARVDRYIDGIAQGFDTPDRVTTHALTADAAIDRHAFDQALIYDRIQLTPMLLWAAGDSIREKLHDLIDRRADPEHAISADERERRLAETDERLASLERDEEQLVCRIEAGGETIDRREEVNPDVVLELREVEDPPAHDARPQPRPRGNTRDAELTTLIR